jgi:hypothetical protein
VIVGKRNNLFTASDPAATTERCYSPPLSVHFFDYTLLFHPYTLAHIAALAVMLDVEGAQNEAKDACAS